MGILDFLGLGNKEENIKDYFEKGAIILDVRTVEEFADGNIENSKNIAVQVLENHLNEVKSWNKPIITCCRSGVRSAKAKNILKQNGIDCINGGGWQSLKSKL